MIKKKVLPMILVIVLLLCILPAVVLMEVSGDYEYSVVNGNATITGYTGAGGDITLPDTLNGFTVTAIGSNVFKDRPYITGVTIPDSVLIIGTSAFSGCSGLLSLSIGNYVTSIDLYAFAYCTGLTGRLTIPDSVITIGIEAFRDCTAVTEVTIGSGVTSIGNNAFFGLVSLTQYNVSTDNSKFSSDSGVLFNKAKTELLHYPIAKTGSAYTVPDSVTSIKYPGFSYCANLNSVTLGSGIKTIGDSSFSHCTNLAGINFPDGLVSIGMKAFEYCALSSVTIPDSVTTIDSYAFQYCSGLTNITLGSGISRIGSFTFYNCSGLTGITIPNSVTSIGTRTFGYCSGLTSITIPDSVTDIEDNAFEYCSGLTGITIPDSVTSIGSYAFMNCNGLANISVGSNNANYSSLSGVLFNKDRSSLICYPAGKTGESYTIPGSVSAVTAWAFAYCPGLTSINIPESVTSIGASAFRYCSNLISANFYGDAPTTFGNYVFDNCATGFTVYFLTGKTGFTTPTWKTYTSSEIAEFEYSVNTDGTSVTITGYRGIDVDIVIPAQIGGKYVTAIGDNAFSGNTGITGVSIPASVSGIGNNAFNGCGSLVSAYFYGDAPALGSNVFDNCAPGFTVYYLTGKSNFSMPTWNGYAASNELSRDVQFDPQGGSSVGSLTVFSGTTITAPEPPVRTGYTFSGWYRDAECTDDWVFTTDIVTGNITLYAKWTVTVTFDSRGGGAVGSISADYGTTITAPEAPVRTGYTFGGWYRETDCVNEWNFSTDTVTEHIILYAKWTINNYTITYYGNGSNGGTAPVDANSPYDYDAEVTVLGSGSLTRTGYAFSGWNTLANGTGTSYPAGGTFNMPAGNVSLYAQWDINNYTVTYYGNGNNGGTAPTDANSPYDYDGEVTVLGSGSLTRTGYAFAGWNTLANGTGTSYAAGGTFNMPAGNVSLYAQWDINNYTVTYYGNGNNGGTAPTDANSPYDYDAEVTALGSGSLTRTGYAFSGWNTLANGTGTSYASGGTFNMPAGNVSLYAQWDINNYTVTYYGNGSDGGTAPTDANSPYDYDAEVTVLGSGSLTRTGYAFSGWNTLANGTGTSYASGGTFNMPAGNVSLYAQWDINNYTVTYYGNGNNGGTAPTDANSPYDYDAEVTVLGSGILTRTGYAFAGWNTQANGTGTSYASGGTFNMPAGNVSLYAQWDINNYTVTYYGNGSDGGTAPTDANSPYDYDAEVTVLGSGSLTRTGYVFSGWNTLANGTGTSYASGGTFNMPAGNVSLYAQWDVNNYTVTYYGNGNNGGTAPTDANSPYDFDEEVTALGSGSLTRTGYAFAGWNTLANGTGTSYASGGTFNMPAGNVSLYAQWDINNYTVTYYGNGSDGGTAPTDANSPYDYDAEVTALGSGSLTRTGYAFSGWNTLANGTGTSYASGGTFNMPAGNVSLYAQWDVNNYTVTYYGNGNNGGTAPTDANSPYDYDAEVTALGSGSLTRTGYAFSGWNTLADGTGTSYAAGGTFNMPAGNVSLYAQWDINNYTVTYYGNGNNGGTAPTDANSPYDYDAEVTALGSGSLTRTGYAFAGWNTLANGTGTSYAAGGTFNMPAGNVSLYAQWDINNYTVTYYGNGNNGGTAPTDANSPYDYDEEVTVLGSGSLTRTGYAFAGWNTLANGTGTSYAAGGTFNMPAGNVSLYAQWDINNYTVTYYGNGSDGGTAPTDANSPYDYDAEVTALGSGSLTRTGYAFAGWNTLANGTGTSYAAGGTFSMPVGNVSLYAQWAEDTYTVTYYGNGNNGGTALTDANSPYDYDAEVTVLGSGSLTKTGYTFAVWNTLANGTGTSYAAGGTFNMPAGNVSLYAQWTPIQYNITFDSAGGTPVDSITEDYGAKLIAPANPTKSGYMFAGWKPAFPKTMPLGGAKLTAQWTNKCTITFNSAGGTAVDSITTDYGAELTAPTYPTKDGYTFAGWNPEFPYTMPIGGAILTAQWTANQYTITFNSSGGTPVDSIIADYGARLIAPANPKKDGYAFASWAPEFPETMPQGGARLTAQYKPNTYTVTFVDYGGSVIDKQDVEYGNDAAAPAAPEREGYVFTRWDTGFTGITADITVKAQYKVALVVTKAGTQNGIPAVIVNTTGLDITEAAIEEGKATLNIDDTMTIEFPNGVIAGDVEVTLKFADGMTVKAMVTITEEAIAAMLPGENKVSPPLLLWMALGAIMVIAAALIIIFLRRRFIKSSPK
jgi:uncharacterized repeat protein (TIGR02543 family)